MKRGCSNKGFRACTPLSPGVQGGVGLFSLTWAPEHSVANLLPSFSPLSRNPVRLAPFLSLILKHCHLTSPSIAVKQVVQASLCNKQATHCYLIVVLFIRFYTSIYKDTCSAFYLIVDNLVTI